MAWTIISIFLTVMLLRMPVAINGYGMGMKEIFALLARSYDTRILPKSASGPIDVQMNISLEHIVDIDVKKGELHAVIGMQLRWSDSRLSWKVDDTEGPIEKVVIPLTSTWMPGITIENLAAPMDTIQSSSATVSHRGSVTWRQVYRVNSYCATNMSASLQTCRLIFLSWIYDMDVLGFSLSSDQIYVNDIGLSSNNWELHSSALNQTLLNFTCCDKPFEGVIADMNFIRIGSEPTEPEEIDNPSIVYEPKKINDEKICNTGTTSSSGNHHSTVRELYMIIALVFPMLSLYQAIIVR